MKFIIYFILAFIFVSLLLSCKKKSEDPPVVVEKPAIGKTYAGGIVFYIDNTGEHGLTAVPNNETYASEWGCEGNSTAASGTAQGTGQQNTTAIVNACATAGIAARICNDRSSSGYSDWYMPSKDELNLMYRNLYLNSMGGFYPGYYWSSSEADSSNAWFQHFGNGYQGTSAKHIQFYFRAIRVF